MQYRYYAKDMQMAADLKQVMRRVRRNRPELFTTTTVRESTMDSEGKVEVTLIEKLRALWHAFPDMRLGQLVENVVSPYDDAAVFHIEDDVVEANIDFINENDFNAYYLREESARAGRS